MVFESIVVELINRYLGTFVENLDTSQLKIGLWGGDVVLNQLNLKESALDDLDLPVKIKAGHIGKLTLKIPWKNLYSEPVIAQIDGIYALAVPNIAIKYNEEKDEKAIQDEKQAKLAKVDEQKKWEAEKDKPRDPKQDSFVEKLATQVIKNLQIKVSNIHVRYEDKYTNSARPFAIGVTLQELLFQTTDANWKETIIKEAVTQIYKLVRLDSLSVYWNSKAEMIQDKDKKEILGALSENIPRQGFKPNLEYLFKPISAVAHLRLHTKPEQSDFSIPKIFLTIVFDEIAINLSKDQYDDILEMLESMERMALMAKYKKTRPEVPYKGHAKEWWHHAYAVTLEHTVRRRRNMWNWTVIKNHRDLMKQYKKLYTTKLDNKKLSGKDQEVVKNCEKSLDVFNILLCRHEAEVNAAKLGKKRAEEKEAGGWLGGWFGGGKKKQKEAEAKAKEGDKSSGIDIGNKFQEEFNDAEKAKLYKAIGYDENAKDPTFPAEFVAVRLVTKFNKLSVALLGGHKKQEEQNILKLNLTEICASFGQRPAANAIRLDAKVDKLRVTGLPRHDYVPKMVNSVGVSKEENTSLLTVSVETNPQDGQCDSRIRVQSRPLEIIFDAKTVNKLATFFRPPESVQLKQLSNAAMAKYDEIKSQTTAGVIHMMSERKYADIEVNLMPSYIIVPEKGELQKNVNMLLLNLGSLTVSSEKTQELEAGIQYSQEQLANYAYDKFNISLDNVQLLFVRPGDSWQDENRSLHSPLYILRPLSLRLLLEKCMFANDPNLPQIRVSGELPLLSVAISENKLVDIMKLAQSIPLPKPPPEPKHQPFFEEPAITTQAARLTDQDFTRVSIRGEAKESLVSELTNFTQIALSFVLREITVELRETKADVETPFLKLLVTRIGVNMKGRTFDMAVDAYLGGVYLQHLQYKMSQGIRDQLAKCDVVTGEVVNIINSPVVLEDEPLLSVNYLQADKKGPEFSKTYNSTVQAISVQFTALDIVLHQGVILSLLEFAKKLEVPQEEGAATEGSSPSSKALRSSTTSLTSTSKTVSTVSGDRSGKGQTDMMLMKVKALIDSIQLSVCNETAVVMHSKVEGIEVGVSMKREKMGVSALMRKIELLDPDPKTKHPKIFSVTGSEVMKFDMTMFNNGTEGKRFDDPANHDIAVALLLGRTRIVFVNKFVMSLVRFMDNFAVAKAKLDEASQAMKEASKDVAKNLQEKAPRIKLDIQVNAPLVVVPQSSRSLEVLMVNLGDINIANKHQVVGSGKTIPGHGHIAEHMIVSLTNLRLSRGMLADIKGMVKSEINILEPMTFKVDLCRNLSTAWWNAIPDVEVTGVLESIKIKMNQEDVKMLMLLSTENIDERDPDGPQPPKQALLIDEKRHREADSGALESYKAPMKSLSKIDEAEDESHCTLKLNFKLVSISVELYRGLVNLDTTTDMQHRVKDKMLTHMTLHTLGVNFNQFSDQSMDAKVFLHDFSMDDCRTERVGGITKLIRRTAFKNLTREDLQARTAEDDNNMVVNVIFTQNKLLDKVVNLHVCSLHICLCVEFLMKVAEFFTKAMPVHDSESRGQLTVAQTVHEQRKTTNKEEAPPPKPVETSGSLDLHFKLDKPEIYLIEDQMDPHTDSLIIDVEVVLRLRMTPDVLSVNGTIKDLSLVSCIFGRGDTRQSVLSPVEINIVGSGPQGKDHHVDISMTDFIMTISPATIRLLTAIAAGMSAGAEEEAVAPKLKDYTDIWQKAGLKERSYWFTSAVDDGTSVDLAENAMSLHESPSRGEMPKRSEKLLVNAPVIVLKLEGGVGHRTVPLLIVESSFSSQVKNWSSDLYVESTLSVEIAYNNEKVGVWEPILEPVLNNNTSSPQKWELSVEVIKTEETFNEDEDAGILPPPKMTINVLASDPLQILMTKTCLDVLNDLGKAFNDAYQLQEMEGTMGQKIVPYVFKNMTGKELAIKPDAAFELAPDSAGVKLDALPSGQDVFMNVKTKKTMVTQNSVIRSTQQLEAKRFSFQMKDSTLKQEISIRQAKKRSFNISSQQVVVNIDAQIGQKIISFVSHIQIKNHLSVPMEIMYHDTSGMLSGGLVYADQVFPVPLAAVYCSTGEIFFQPKIEGQGYSVSKDCIKWKTLVDAKEIKFKEICCENTNPGSSAYYFNVLPEFEKIFHEMTDDKTDQLITLHLNPTVILHNLLPFDITYVVAETETGAKLEAGHNIPLNNASVNQTHLELQIPDYRGLQWKGKKLIKLDVPELSVWTFQAEENGQPVYMDLGLHSKVKQGSFDLSVYSPYWIINLAEQDLALKEDDKEAPVVHKKDNKGIMLFYFRDKPLFGSGAKRKVSLRIAEADWSDKFSLDTVGSSGNVSCKNKATGHTMEVGVKIALASSGLTKIVTFTPFYVLLNATTVQLKVREAEGKPDAWTTIEPGECKGYYPETVAKEMKICAKVSSAQSQTLPFFLNKAHTTLLRLDDEYGGLNAECQVSEAAMITTFHLYKPGMATVLFVNHTSQCTVSVKQVGSKEEPLQLEPQTSQLYTWSDPTLKREVLWTCGNKKDTKSALDQDNLEEFFAQNDVKVYFVSFLDGLQRVVMFTQDLALATVAQEAGELEQADQEINVKIHDMGFSLINNEKMLELAYMGITSSGVIWEEKRKRYKAMKLKDMAIIEHAYQKYMMEQSAGKTKSLVSLENKMEVDFEAMQLTKPKPLTIRRSFEDGIWIQMRKSPHSMQFHAKVNRLQFDDQLRHAVFPTILSPLPPPKSVAADSVPKPFVEVSLMTRIHEHSSLVQVKYFKVLIQEMNLKVDQGFLNEVLEMFASDVDTLREQEVANFKNDVTSTKRDLKEETGVSMQSKRISFYDYFHISPIKIHLSFSLQGGSMSDSPQANVMGVFLQSVGVVLTDVQDVVFKLGYFERNHSFYNNSQLTSEFIRHYSGQAVKQMYVLVLGLDVLGNPFGLLRGLSEGIEDLFYEPYQGAIQGPQEFAEGLALGVRSLFGHAVGGAAGAVSRITGTLGKGLAALTLDDDYQKKRREQLNKRPATAREGFARGGKGLVMGVFDGVTGIVRKPVEGAKQEGVTGFFKGMGKGLVGVVTRPTSGVVDFASSSLEGIRRITDFSEEIHRLRPPRRFNRDGVVRPYIREEAEGYNLLLETDKGKYVESDEYITHVKVKEDGKLVFIVTDKRVMLAKRGEIFGSWDTEWMFIYADMKGAPKQTAKGIEILLREKEKKKLFSSNVVKKEVQVADPKVAQTLLEKITTAMEAEKVESGV